MNSIFFFIKKHGGLLLFIVLQITSIIFFVIYNRFPNIVFGEWIFYNSIKIQANVKDFSDYLSLKEKNNALLEENTMLRNQLQYNYISYQKKKDTAISFIKQYDWLKTEPVELIKKQNSIFLIVRGGESEGIEENMAIVSSQGVVGNIIKVYKNYSVATTLLNEKTKIIGKVVTSNTFSALEWNELTPAFLVCKNFPQNTAVKIGDTISSSSYSVKYPPDLPIGRIVDIGENKQTRELVLNIKPFVDYNMVSQIYIIKNKDHHILENIKSEISQ